MVVVVVMVWFAQVASWIKRDLAVAYGWMRGQSIVLDISPEFGNVVGQTGAHKVVCTVEDHNDAWHAHSVVRKWKYHHSGELARYAWDGQSFLAAPGPPPLYSRSIGFSSGGGKPHGTPHTFGGMGSSGWSPTKETWPVAWILLWSWR